MDVKHGEYPQSDQSSNTQYTPQHSATSTNSDSSIYPSSARSSNFPEYVQRSPYTDGSSRYAPPSGNTPTGNMAQPQNPSIAGSSPTYPPHHYPPYGPPHDMPQHYQPPMYAPRADYGYPAHPGMPGPYGHVATSGGHPLSTVYSFVPIPGTHQQKRPRRRYEEIERMYKCGWQGCEKAYGTLNHLNAHVTMQSHGAKRTPEEFKEIRKEWKARKKEEESARKQEEERARAQHSQAVSQNQAVEGQTQSANGSSQQHTPTSNGYSQRQLPPLGYAPAAGGVPPQYSGQANAGHMEGVPQYSNAPQMPSYGYPPQSPYGSGQQQM